MTTHEFIHEVQKMRTFQKEYFAARYKNVPDIKAILEKSKAQEKYVDHLLVQYKKSTSPQQSLF